MSFSIPFNAALFFTVVTATIVITFSDLWIEKSEGEHGVGEATLDQKDSTSLLLHRAHPGCFDDALFTENRSLSLLKTGKFIQVSPDEQPNYDHVSCFLMKARYNCAKSSPPAFGEAAFHYKLILQSPSQEDEESQAEICDLKRLMTDLGGPGIRFARHLTNTVTARHLTNAVTDAHNNNLTSPSEPVQVVLLGNSLLRQTFESIACSFRDQITSVHVEVGGPTITVATMAARAHDKFRTEELGVWTQLDHLNPKGCHDGLSTHFYEENVTLPTSINNCTDDVASVVFDNKLEFIFVFRPNLFANQTELLDYAGVDPKRVHSVIISERTELHEEVWDKLRGVPYQYWDMRPFRNMQERDLHRWFGADNPGMDQIPDGHGCMPGVPDDEANVLLYSLLTNVSIDFKSS